MIRKRIFMTLVWLAVSWGFVVPSGAGILQEAATCRECHTKIYDQWITSRHASSFTEPLFRKAFKDVNETSPEMSSLCVSCHAPVAALSGGSIREGMVESEGVTCDFCHTVLEVVIKDDFPRYKNSPGTKRGPIDQAKSRFHKSEFSPLTLESRFCAGCHEYKNGNGVGILTTCSEWEESYYSGKGIHCQYCHLPQLYKDKKYLQVSKRKREPADHGMKGGHYPALLKDTLDVSGTMKLSDDGATVKLYLFNDKSGHKLPTGIPTHRVSLVTSIYDGEGGKIAEKSVYLERILGDEFGRPLYSPAEVFLKARKVIKDTRLGPKEKKRVKLQIPLAGDINDVSAKVSLYYEQLGEDTVGKRERIHFASIAIPLQGDALSLEPFFLFLFLAGFFLIVYRITRRMKARKPR